MVKIVAKKKIGNSKIEWNKKTTLVMTILTVLVVGLVVVNFERFTGRAVTGGNAVPKVYVSSKLDTISEDNVVIKKGSNVYITVETGSEGVKNPVSIYSKVKSDYYSSDYYSYGRVATTRLRYGIFNERASSCGSFCSSNRVVSGYITTGTGSVWSRASGVYCAVAEEKGTGKKVEACFNVE